MKKTDELTKEELIEKIYELEKLIEILKEEKNQGELLKFPWAGNLGQWHWDIKNDDLICNDKKILVLGYTKDEIPKNLGFEFFTEKLHLEDYERVMYNMIQHLDGNTEVWEAEYRIMTKAGGFKWYYDRGQVTKRDINNKGLVMSGIVFDITEQKEMEQLIQDQNKKLEEVAEFDYLTNVLNRRGLYKRLEDQIEISKKRDENLSVILFDIDFFKLVNDKQGHLIGDKVLKQVALNIKRNILGSDIVGRYGGEEFLVILPKSNKEKAYIVGERVRKSIESEQFANGTRVTISGGVKEYDNESINMFLDRADKNLYHAKENGRNQIVRD